MIDELRAGGAAALGVIFDRYADRVYNFCFRLTGSWSTAEDNTSTVFMEAWRSRTSVVAADGIVLPWLYGIARNVCRNSQRKDRRHRSALGRIDRDPGLQPDHALEVITRVDDERVMTALLPEVAKLPRVEREVLELIAWGELTYSQAAALLGIPIGTVRSRLARARRRLADPMAPTHHT